MTFARINARSVGIIALSVISPVLLVAGCGTDGGEGTPRPTATSSTSISTPTDLPPVPTAAELNNLLERGFDPSVPLQDKVSLVQGAGADPEIIDKVAQAARTNNATVDVVDVTDLGDGTLSSNANIVVNGQSSPFQATFVAEDGVWKLSRDNACAIVTLANLTSPACS